MPLLLLFLLLLLLLSLLLMFLLSLLSLLLLLLLLCSYVRSASGYYQAVKQLNVLAGGSATSLMQFADAMGVAQHHDAVSGTSKQHVAYDYALRISKGYGDGMNVAADALQYLVGKTPAGFSQCPDANVSICASTETLPFVAVVYNQLAQPVSTIVKIPVSTTVVSVLDSNNSVIISQVVDADDYDIGMCSIRAVFFFMCALCC